MHRILAAIRGAGGATIVWYIFNPMVGNAGIAFVAWMGWPWGTAWLTVAVGAVVGILHDSFRRRRERQQSAEAITTADDLALAYTPTVERPISRLPCFANWVRGADGNTGEIGGVPVSVFDMNKDINSDRSLSRTMVLLSASGLPCFTATPRGFGGQLGQAIGFGAITFDPAAAQVAFKGVVRQFGREVRIEAPGDPLPWDPAAAEKQAQEDAIRRLFTPALMSTLLKYSGWSFQSDGEWLACWRGDDVWPASERLKLMATAGKIHAALVAALADSPPTGLPPLPGLTPGQYLARVYGAVLGGILGALVGFFGTVIGGLETAPGIKLEGPDRLFAGVRGGYIGGVSGIVLGYGIGMAIGWLPSVARWTPQPKDTTKQYEEKRIQKNGWIIGCGCIGLFVGFFTGIIIVGILALKGNMDGGLMWDGRLLICIPFGGAITGAVVVSIIGRRLVHRKAADNRGQSPSHNQ